jgi:hypothetical protein
MRSVAACEQLIMLQSSAMHKTADEWNEKSHTCCARCAASLSDDGWRWLVGFVEIHAWFRK